MTKGPDAIAAALRAHLAKSSTSMRALSFEAGLGEKAVSHIISGRTNRPDDATLAALSLIVGVDLAAMLKAERAPNEAEVRRFLSETPPGNWSEAMLRGVRTAFGFYARHQTTGADPASRPFDRNSVQKFLASNTPKALGVSQATWGTYASHLGALLDGLGAERRPVKITDVVGPMRALYDKAARMGLPQDLVYAGGPFLAYCAARDLGYADVDAQCFVAYRDHRIAHGRVATAAQKHHKAAKRAFAFWNRLARAPGFAALGLRMVEPPFGDRRLRYETPPELLEPILREFDQSVVPWLSGDATPDGRSCDDVLKEIEALELPSGGAKAAAARKFVGERSRNRCSERNARLLARGILIDGKTWCPRRIAVARAGVVSLVKCHYAASGIMLDSMEELTDPDILEAAAEALDQATDPDDLGSSYVVSLLKMMRKIAAGHVGRDPEEMERIGALIAAFTPDYAGMSPRNKLRLQQFTPERIDAFFAMSGEMIGEVNAEVGCRRAAIRRATAAGRPAPTLIDAEIARDLELVVAHDILCARAPRSANVLGIDLDRHVRTGADGNTVIELPAEMVKGGRPLKIPLNAQSSATFQRYVSTARAHLLTDANRGSTLLFPSRQSETGTYSRLFDRLMREIRKRIGVTFNPHLYRHLIGWAWLREDPGALPQVQILLGHRKLETTLRFYAELDETLALQGWNDYVEDRKNAAKNARTKRALAA